MEKFFQLQEALMSGDFNNFKVVLRNVGNINSSDCKGSTQSTILHYFIANSSKLSYKPQDVIAAYKNVGGKLEDVAQGGFSLLHAAVGVYNKEIVAALLDEKLHIDMVDSKGNTPLWRAVSNFRGEPKLKDFILFLLSKGANIDLKNNYDNSPRDVIMLTGKGIDQGVNNKDWDLRDILPNL